MTKLLLILMMALLWTYPAKALGEFCGSRDSIIEELERLGEYTLWVGTDARGTITELLVDPVDETWSIITTYTNGRTCFKAVGREWKLLEITNGERV